MIFCLKIFICFFCVTSVFLCAGIGYLVIKNAKINRRLEDEKRYTTTPRPSSPITAPAVPSQYVNISTPALSTNSTVDTNVTTTTKFAPSNMTATLRPPASETAIGEVIPIHYEIYMKLNTTSEVFEGKETITIKVIKNTTEVVLHCHHLRIICVHWEGNSWHDTEKLKFNLDPNLQLLNISCNYLMVKNEIIKVIITFEGAMRKQLTGLYQISRESNTSSITATKLRPCYARNVFPCFDEPSKKATFNLTLEHNIPNYQTISNMDLMKTITNNSSTNITFKETPRISSYLVFFLVGDLQYKEIMVTNSISGKLFTLRFYSTKELQPHMDFAVNSSKTILESLFDYFKVDCRLSKLDILAIPDFTSIPTEHWSAISFKDTDITYKKDVDLMEKKNDILLHLGQKFAQMWFGNLVTLKWWNDLWINEGFPTYFGLKGIDATFEDRKTFEIFQVDQLHAVMKTDATLDSQPIIRPVNDAQNIENAIDAASMNSKSTSILRMLEGVIGLNNFKKIISNIVNNYKYQNVDTNDIIREFQKFRVGDELQSLIRTYTEQMGLPVLNVEKVQNFLYKLTQRRFLSNPHDYEKNVAKSFYKYFWSIPITYKTNLENRTQLTWLYYNQTAVLVKLPSAVKWIKFNIDQVGYYRVRYPEGLWANLTIQLMKDHKVFSACDRACLLNDAFSLADAMQIPYFIALNLTKYLKNETEHAPWRVAVEKLTFLDRMLRPVEFSNEFMKYAHTLLNATYNIVGWEVDDNYPKHRLRIDIFDAACSLRFDKCLSDTSTILYKFLDNPEESPPKELRKIVYYYGLKAAGNKTWLKMWNLYLNETDTKEKGVLLYGLSGISVPLIIDRFLKLAWNESLVSGENFLFCIESIASNPPGDSRAWYYVRQKWPELVKRFTLDNNDRSNLRNMLAKITSQFATQDRYDELNSFLNKYPEAGGDGRNRRILLENVKSNIAWINRNGEKIRKWLKENTLKN